MVSSVYTKTMQSTGTHNHMQQSGALLNSSAPSLWSYCKPLFSSNSFTFLIIQKLLKKRFTLKHNLQCKKISMLQDNLQVIL